MTDYEGQAHQSYLVWWVFVMLAKIAAVGVAVAVGGLVVGLVLVHSTGDPGWLLLGFAGLTVQPLVFPLVVWTSMQPRLFTELPGLEDSDAA